MRTSTVSYPYPVIGNENDAEGRFVVAQFIRSTDPDTLTFNYEFEVTNQSLIDLLQDNKAQYVMQIECSGTFQRFAHCTRESKGVFQIPANKLREKVVVRFFICAATGINGYLPKGSHADYAGVTFDIEPGDVLAVGGHTSFIAEKTFDPLNAPLDSLFRIKAGNIKGELQAQFDQDKIVIVLAEDDFKLFREALGRRLHDNIHATVVYPVLVEALNLMKKELGEYENYTWFERINQICIDRGYNLDFPLETAQKILSNPVGRNFKQLEAELSKLDNEGDD